MTEFRQSDSPFSSSLHCSSSLLTPRIDPQQRVKARRSQNQVVYGLVGALCSLGERLPPHAAISSRVAPTSKPFDYALWILKLRR